MLKLIQMIEYNVPLKGVCNGMVGMLIQAAVVEDTATFWNRLQLIAEYKSDLNLLLDKIKAVKLKVIAHTELTQQDLAMLEVLAFLDGIQLYHSSNDYRDFFDNKFVHQDNYPVIYNLAKPANAETDNIHILLDKTYAGTRDDLRKYFTALAKILSKQPSISIKLGNTSHAVYVSYNHNNATKPWLYFDVNDWKLYPDHEHYYRELTHAEFIKSIFISLSPHSQHCIFNVIKYLALKGLNISG